MTNPSLPAAAGWPLNETRAMDGAPVEARLDPLRKAVIWMIAAYLVLNVGFEFVRIPPVGFGIPIGELILGVCLIVIRSRSILPMMAREVWLLPIVFWWALSLCRALIDARTGGFWSFRDASQAIESLYLIVGFWFASSDFNFHYFFRWLKRVLIAGALYGLLYPVSGSLQAFSPKLHGVGTGATPILFSMSTMPLLMMWCAAWLLIERPANPRSAWWRNLCAGFLVAFAVAFGQSRSNYLQVLALGIVLLLVKRKAAAKWGVVVLIGAVIIGAVSLSGIELRGRVGKQVSLNFIAEHFETLSGSGEESVENTAEGVSLRINWWRHIFEKMKSSPKDMIFGLGYGVPLTSFQGVTSITREPHNSYISVIGRLGVSGFAMYLFMQIALYYSWWRAFRLARKMGWTEDQDHLLMLLMFGFLTLVAMIGEAAMEVPFYAIPYYFFFGVVLRYRRHLSLAAREASVEERA